MTHDERKRVVDRVLGTDSPDAVLDAVAAGGGYNTLSTSTDHGRCQYCCVVSEFDPNTNDPPFRKVVASSLWSATRAEAVYDAAYKFLDARKLLPTPSVADRLKAKVDDLANHQVMSHRACTLRAEIRDLVDRLPVPSGGSLGNLRDAVAGFDARHPESRPYPSDASRSLRDAAKRLLDELAPDEVTK